MPRGSAGPVEILHTDRQSQRKRFACWATFSTRTQLAQCLAGAAYLQENELDLAQQFLGTRAERDRKLVDARINLAEVYARKGEHAKAARYMMAARDSIAELTNP